MGKTEGLIRYRANLQGEIDSAALVEEALRWAAELIVLGTHGRTGLARAALPSGATASIAYQGNVPGWSGIDSCNH
jgi:nucleotide-binding universal stress UspA family protein